ncbi:MAG TPA: hypothetical protein DDX85_13685 [Nitrospiraceae bacterium]|nr:hypothetical protein [Nitrospiraceae bacterium]
MKSIIHFLRVTIVGGILFLVPVIVLTIVIGKAFQIARMVVRPLSGMIPVETVAGIALAKLLAIMAIVVFCLLAGMFAKTAAARKMISWMENTLLSNLPGYHLMKGIGESAVGVESDKPHEAVLARIEDAWQIAFLVERIEGGHVAVFIPGAPNPWSGSVYFMTWDRIKPLDIPVMSALNCLQGLGTGANALLKGKL